MASVLKEEMDRRGLAQKELGRLPNYSLAAKQYRGERRVSVTYCLHYNRLFGIDPAVLRPDFPWPKDGNLSTCPIGVEAEEL